MPRPQANATRCSALVRPLALPSPPTVRARLPAFMPRTTDRPGSWARERAALSGRTIRVVNERCAYRNRLRTMTEEAAALYEGELLCEGELLEDRYRIVRPICRSGMSSVYLAEHERIRRLVAVKVLQP